ncbi:hypothetical protein P5637_07585 [Bacillus paralicheniformis]|uniref:hypothetical protein n=1 Tax=Bacillus TaxID=1386 RepID=UPI0004787B82|nr:MULTISPECIES: hypothetical protein [Bacillus]KND06254.1 hypothetical protein ACJ43_17965 [Bacillus paralicheniformis]MBK4208921.1 hypothetical protein [Bacillus licheniformis]MDE1403226.1 hypothetical protein [Bacillus licheniformis]OJT57506.1 hypothetical protein BFP47_12475 [Bacillus licheniformis]OJT69852.1 hypothetical protein BFP46_04410 [Bacillus licheniformis]
MAEVDVNTRLSVLEEKMKNHQEKITNLEARTEDMSRLTTLMEQQIEINKDAQKQSREQFVTLTEMNNSLKNLSKSYEKLDNRVGILEQSDSNRKIDPSQFGKDLMYKVLPTVIATLVGAWLLIHFGLK